MIAQSVLINNDKLLDMEYGTNLCTFQHMAFKKKLRSQVCVALTMNDWNEDGQSESQISVPLRISWQYLKELFQSLGESKGTCLLKGMCMYFLNVKKSQCKL